MKTWNNPEISELQINMTSENGSKATTPDGNWTDQDGNAWTSYASAGDLGGPDITVTK